MSKAALQARGTLTSVRLLLFLFAAALLIPVLLVGAAILLLVADEEAAEVRRNTLATAVRVASLVDHRIEGIEIALDALSESRIIDDADDQAFRQRTADVGALAGRPVRYQLNSGVVVSAGQPEPHGVWIRAPILRGGAQVGALEAQLTGAELSRTLAAEAPSAEWTLSIVSREGRILARSKEYETFAGQLATPDLRANAKADAGTWEGRTLNGERVAAAYKRSAGSDLVIATGVPLRAITAPFWRSAGALLAMTGLALVTSFGMGAVVGAWIARPLGRLSSSSRALPAERPTAGRVLVREIADLERALGEAADKMIAHEASQQAEIARRTRTEKQLRLVVNELNHRVKNTLAIVQSLSMQTFRNTKEPELALETFTGRLQTLASAHDLLTATGWEGADLHRLVLSSLEPLAAEAGRIRCSGPALMLPSDTAVSMAMVLHELGTNALKYGALSAPEGHVLLEWQVNAGELALTWQEVGGPPVQLPRTSGFGSRLLQRALNGAGRSEIEFDPAGVRWTCVVPLPHGAEAGGANRQPAVPSEAASDPTL